MTTMCKVKIKGKFHIRYEYDDGVVEYHYMGKLHREDNGPSVFMRNSSYVRYSKNGKYHREDGPAVINADGVKYWYKNGELHREDGPAIESPSGYKRWYLYGRSYSEKEFLALTASNK